MDNLQSPAYPSLHWDEGSQGTIFYFTKGGFTKIEKAALMIAAAWSDKATTEWTPQFLAEQSVVLAKAVLEEANKEEPPTLDPAWEPDEN